MANEMWIVAQMRGGKPSRATAQILSEACRLAGQKGLVATAVLLGGGREAALGLAALSDAVIWFDEQRLDEHDAVVHSGVLSGLVASRGAPVAILATAGPRELETMPRLAAMCSGGYAGSCVGLRWDGDSLVARRPIHGGKVYEEVAFENAPAVITVRPGSFDVADSPASPGAVEEVSVTLPEPSGMSVVDRAPSRAGGMDLADAATVVAGGRGVSGGSYRMVEDLARALEGVPAASRALVDAGERPHEVQVGKSGKTVSPELYIACGISGAIHHTLGMNTSKVVVAINSDPDAPIFQSADFGLVGDATTVLPQLIEAIKTVKG